MRELDDLLMNWVDKRFDAAADVEISAFESLLALPDPEIAAYLLQQETPASECLALIVRQILDTDPA